MAKNKIVELGINITPELNERDLAKMFSKLDKYLENVKKNDKLKFETDETGITAMKNKIQALYDLIAQMQNGRDGIAPDMAASFNEQLSSMIKNITEFSEKYTNMLEKLGNIGLEVNNKNKTKSMQNLASEINNISGQSLIDLDSFKQLDATAQFKALSDTMLQLGNAYGITMTKTAQATSNAITQATSGTKQLGKEIEDVGNKAKESGQKAKKATAAVNTENQKTVDELKKQLAQQTRISKSLDYFKTGGNGAISDKNLKVTEDRARQLVGVYAKLEKSYKAAMQVGDVEKMQSALLRVVPVLEEIDKMSKQIRQQKIVFSDSDLNKYFNKAGKSYLLNRPFVSEVIVNIDKQNDLLAKINTDIQNTKGQLDIARKAAEQTTEEETKVVGAMQQATQAVVEGNSKKAQSYAEVTQAAEGASEVIKNAITVPEDAITEMDKLRLSLANIFSVDVNENGAYDEIFEKVETGARTAQQALEEIVKAENQIQQDKYYNIFDKYDSESWRADKESRLLEKERDSNRRLQKELEELQRELHEQYEQERSKQEQSPLTSEQQSLETLKNSINDVKTAVAQKTSEFTKEQEVVLSVVEVEKQALHNLEVAIQAVKETVEQKTVAFQNEQSTVDTVVASEIAKLDELHQKLVSIKDLFTQIFGVSGQQITVNENVDHQAQTVIQDSTLVNALQTLNNTLSGALSQLQGNNNQPITVSGLDTISQCVDNIYVALTNNTVNQDLTSLINELSNKIAPISEESKIKTANNDKYSSATSRIASDGERHLMVDNVQKTTGQSVVQGTEQFTALANGLVKVKAVLQDANGELSDFAATIDSKGTVAIQQLEKDGVNAIQVAQQIAEVQLKAQNEALKQQQTIPVQTLAGPLKQTKNIYDAYASENVGNINAKIKQSYEELLRLIQQVKNEDRDMTQAEAQYAEQRIQSIQKEIATIKNREKQKALKKEYGDKISAYKTQSKNITDPKDSTHINNLIANMKQKQQQLNLKNGLLDENQLAQAKTELDQLATQIETTFEKIQNKIKINNEVALKSIQGLTKQAVTAYENYTKNNQSTGSMDSNYKKLLLLLEQAKQSDKELTQAQLSHIQNVAKALASEIAQQHQLNQQLKVRKQLEDKANGLSQLRSTIDQTNTTKLAEFDKLATSIQTKINAISKTKLINSAQLKTAKQEINDLFKSINHLMKGSLTQGYSKQFDKIKQSYDSFKSDVKQQYTGTDTQDTAMQQALNNITNAYNRLEVARNKLINTPSGSATNQDKIEFEEAAKSANAYLKEIEQLQNAKAIKPIDQTTISDVNALKVAMEQFAESLGLGKMQESSFNATTNQLTATMRDADGNITEVIVDLGTLTNTIRATTGETKKAQTFWEQFSNSLRKKSIDLASYLATYVSLRQVWAVFKQGVTAIKEIDDALTELKKVTDETDEAYSNFLTDMSKTAGQVGSTVKDLTTMAANWARLGYSMDDSATLAKNNAVLLNVSEFQDAETAAEALISVMQAYGYAADESEHVVDILNEVGNNFAVSTDGLATALQDSGSALAAAGNSLEQSVALVAAANKVLQDPSKVGGSLRTISLRIRGTTVKALEEMGEETDGVVESVSKLQEQIKYLTGVNILNDAGGYKDTYTILKEISEVWGDMADMDKAATLEMLAGKNRSNALAAILTNFDDLDGAYKDAMQASGSAENELNTFLDSVSGRMQLFTNAVQTFWHNFIDTDVVKNFISFGTTIMNVLNGIIGLLNKLGPLGKIVEYVAPLLAIVKVYQKITSISGHQNGAFGIISSLFDALKGGNIQSIFTMMANGIDGITAKVTSATSAINGFAKIINALNFGNIASNLSGLTGVFANLKAALGFVGKENIGANITDVLSKFIGENVDFSILLNLADPLQNITDLTKEQAAEFLNLAVQQRACSQATAQQMAAYFGLQVAENGTIVATEGLALAFKNLAASMLAFFLTNPVGQFMLLVGALVAVYAIYKKIGPTHENFVKKYQKANEEFEESTSKLKELNDQIEENKKCIDELQDKEMPSYADEEEIRKLKAQNAELERQAKLEEAINKQKQEQARTTLVAALKNDPAVTSTSGAYTGSNYFQGAVGADSSAAMSYAANATNNVSGLDAKTNAYLKAKEELDKANAEMTKVLNDGMDIESKDFKKIQKRVENAEQTTETAYTKLSSAYEDFNEDYPNLISNYDFDHPDSEDNKIIKDALALRDKVALALSDDKVSIFDYLFDENSIYATDTEEIRKQAKTLRKQYDAALKSGDSSAAKSVVDKMADSIANSPINDYLKDVGLNATEAAKALLKVGEYAQATTSVGAIDTTISTLTTQVESENDAVSKSNEVIYEGMKISDEYYESLSEYLGDVTIGTEDLSDAIDVNNGKVVKNARLLRQLINQKKQDRKATIAMAKSQSQLKYATLVKQLAQATNIMAKEYAATGKLSKATLNNVGVLQSQIKAVKTAIREYAILELKLSSAANAYDEFEDAKNRDAELGYGDSMIEMLQAINDGFASGKVGSEAFKAACDALVPDSVIADCDNFEERLDKIFDYFENSDFADYFTIDEDGSLSITLKNLENFIKDCQNADLFTTNADGTFSLVEGVKGLDDFAKKLNITEEAALAMLTTLSQYDASWGNILSDLTNNSFDKEITTTTDNLEKLVEKQQQFIKENGDLNSDEYKQLVTDIQNAQKAYDDATNAAITNANQYSKIQTVYKMATGEIQATDSAVQGLLTDLNLIDDNGEYTFSISDNGTLQLSDSQLQALHQLLEKCEEPSYMDVQLNYDQVTQQIDQLEAFLADPLGEPITINGVEIANIYEAKKQLAELKAQKDQIEQDNPNIIQDKEEDNFIDEMEKREVEGYTIPIKADFTEAEEARDKYFNSLDNNGESDEETESTDWAKNATTWVNDKFIPGVKQSVSNFNEWYDNLPEQLNATREQFQEAVINFFTNTIPEKWNEFWTVIGDFLDTYVAEPAQAMCDAIANFFTVTIPEKWGEFWNTLTTAFDTYIADPAKALGEAISTFFTDTLPQAWSDFWTGLGEVLDTYIGQPAQIVGDAIANFITVTLPEKWTEFWNNVDDLFGEDVSYALGYAISEISTFFTKTIPTAINTAKSNVVQFFTQTIPTAWSNFWNSVQNFVTQTVPTALTTLKQGVTNFFTVSLPQMINGLWTRLTTWVSTEISNFWSNLKGGLGTIISNFKKGRNDSQNDREFGATKAKGNAQTNGNSYAKGNAHAQEKSGLKTNEHNAIVGELGRELVCDVNKGVYYTVGEHGTEMVDLPKGAIIYNHKQTAELLGTGKTSARGTLVNGGLSFAKGNAHAWQYGTYSKHFKADGGSVWNNGSDGIGDAASDLSGAADDLSDATDEFEDSINWIEVLFNRIEGILSEQELILELQKDNASALGNKSDIYNDIFSEYYYKYSKSQATAEYYRREAEKAMEGLDEAIKEKIRSGHISIEEFKGDANEKKVDKINKAIELYDSITTYTQQAYQTLIDISTKAKEQFDDVKNSYDNEMSFTQDYMNKLSSLNSLSENKYGFGAKGYLDGQIEANETLLKQYQSQRDALKETLDEKVRLGQIEVNSQDWYDMVNEIYAVDDAIIDTESSIEDLNNALNDLHWSYFDELINRFGYLEDEISNVIQLLSHDDNGLVSKELKDLLNNNGWATDSGLATIGLYAQQMEQAQYESKKYAEEIKYLDQAYKEGKYNETEYLAKLNELTSAQYASIEKYHDAKDAIVDLNKARVDAIKDGIQKEIDAYTKLINKKKEELSAEKSLHDFQNDVKQQRKNIADLENQLMALQGDNSASAAAKRKQIEADLYAAQEDLQETYYDHSMDAKNDALDKELSDFEEEKNKEIESWEKWLEDSKTVISSSLEYVKANTSEVYGTLTQLGAEYGLSISTSITEPWANGTMSIDEYSANFETAVSNWTGELDKVVAKWQELQNQVEATARSQMNALNQKYDSTPKTTTPSSSSNNSNNNSTASKPASTPQKAITVGSQINAGSATIYSDCYGGGGGKQYFRSDPVYTVLQEQNGYILVRHHSLSSGYSGWFRKGDIKGYKHGTLGVDEDQLALINELGDELVMNADPNGKLTYLTKGSSVVPHDITEKIMNLAIDPVSALADSMPKIKIPNVNSNNFDFNMSFGSLVHVDHADKDSIPELQKMVRSEFDNMMKNMNSKLRRT